MGAISGEDEEDIKDAFDESLEVDKSEKLVDALEEALEHADDKEAEYWIRTALQHLIAEKAVPEDGSD